MAGSDGIMNRGFQTWFAVTGGRRVESLFFAGVLLIILAIVLMLNEWK